VTEFTLDRRWLEAFIESGITSDKNEASALIMSAFVQIKTCGTCTGNISGEGEHHTLLVSFLIRAKNQTADVKW
jgi:hypothetical protein